MSGPYNPCVSQSFCVSLLRIDSFGSTWASLMVVVLLLLLLALVVVVVIVCLQDYKLQMPLNTKVWNHIDQL